MNNDDDDIDRTQYPVLLDTFQMGIILTMLGQKQKAIVDGTWKPESPGVDRSLLAEIKAIEAQIIDGIKKAL